MLVVYCVCVCVHIIIILSQYSWPGIFSSHILLFGHWFLQDLYEPMSHNSVIRTYSCPSLHPTMAPHEQMHALDFYSWIFFFWQNLVLLALQVRPIVHGIPTNYAHFGGCLMLSCTNSTCFHIVACCEMRLCKSVACYVLCSFQWIQMFLCPSAIYFHIIVPCKM